MRKSIIVYLIILLSSSVLISQNHIEEFGLLRQNDKYKKNDSTEQTKVYKNIPIGNTTTLSFGGSYRNQLESYINEDFISDSSRDSFWILNRLMAHTHLKIDKRLELFGEVNSSFIFNKDHQSPVDKDNLNINQLFLSYNITNAWNFSIGRKNLRLGSGRLIDIREGPNVRLSFDLIQFNYKTKESSLCGFYALPVQIKDGVFDNKFLKDNEKLVALYWTQMWKNNMNTDIYLLYKFDEDKKWNLGINDDKRYTVGLRTFGEFNTFKYNNEFMYQFGKFGMCNIDAWAVSINLEKLISSDSVFGIKADAISGDKNKTDNSLNTFNGLYPRGAYFGKVAYFSPSNLIAIQPYFQKSIKDFTLKVDYGMFWRYSKNDGVYTIPTILTYESASDSNDRQLASQAGIILGYSKRKNIKFEIEYNLIVPDEFLKNKEYSKNLHHFVFTAEIKL